MNWAANKATKGLGASFKGVGLYLLNPKAENQTRDERVGFTLCRNLATDDPDQAWRLMAETAIRREQIKELAGGSKAGRKPAEGAFRPVFHYALSWHPDQRPDDAEMRRAAEGSIRSLGLEHHEALIVQHCDQGHAHLHVVINRVDPDTGKLDPLSNSFRKLDRWAAEYERETGEIVSLQRDAKHEALKEGRKPPAKERTWLPHEEWTQTRRAANENAPAQGLWGSQVDERAAQLDDAKVRARELAQALREQQRPGWAALGRNQAMRTRALEEGLESRAGMIAFINQNREWLHKAWPDADRREAEWASLLTRGGLTAACARAQAMETAEFRRDVAHDRHAMQRAFWSDYRDKLGALRDDQTRERAEAKVQRQAGEGAAHVTAVTGARAQATLPTARRPDKVPAKATAATRAPELRLDPPQTLTALEAQKAEARRLMKVAEAERLVREQARRDRPQRSRTDWGERER